VRLLVDALCLPMAAILWVMSCCKQVDLLHSAGSHACC